MNEVLRSDPTLLTISQAPRRPHPAGGLSTSIKRSWTAEAASSRYGGRRASALLDRDGTLRDLSGIVPDIDGELRSPTPPRSPAYGGRRDAVCRPPWTRRAADRSAGRTHRQDRVHRAELLRPRDRDGCGDPAEPILFFKAPDTVVGPDDTVLVSRGSRKTDWEVELAVVIGRTARYLLRRGGARPCRRVRHRPRRLRARVPDRARRHLGQGQELRDVQPAGSLARHRRRGGRPQALPLRLWVNGELKQNGTTAEQIFPVGEVVRYLSHFMTLYPGDVINTGTPAVAMGQP